MSSVYLRKPKKNDIAEIKEAYARSVELHHRGHIHQLTFKHI